MTTQRGLIDSVATTPLGTVTTADATAGQTVLAVDWTAEFAATGGLLMLGDTTLPYASATESDDGLAAITLRDPLAADVAAGEPVTSLTAAGEPRLSVEVFVAFDEGEEPVPYAVASPLQGRITEDTPTGTPVLVDLSVGRVVGRDNAQAQLDGNSVWNPYLARRVTTPFSVAAVGWTTVTTWSDTVLQGVIVEPDGSLTIAFPGFYVFDASPSYVSNSTGSRAARFLVNGEQRGYLAIPADAVGSTEVPVGFRRPLVEGDNIVFQLSQSSGAALNLSSVNESPFSLYRTSV